MSDLETVAKLLRFMTMAVSERDRGGKMQTVRPTHEDVEALSAVIDSASLRRAPVTPCPTCAQVETLLRGMLSVMKEEDFGIRTVAAVVDILDRSKKKT